MIEDKQNLIHDSSVPKVRPTPVVPNPGRQSSGSPSTRPFSTGSRVRDSRQKSYTIKLTHPKGELNFNFYTYNELMKFTSGSDIVNAFKAIKNS